MLLRQILPNIDETDNKIIELLVQGKSNQEISKEINVPISTVQRRTRAILNKEIVTSTVQINYVLLGFKTGLIHV
jgi:DNA-binding NarL/FixJ family response regulator